MESHITPDVFGQFLSGTCKPEQAGYVEAHIDACDECRQVLSNLVRSQRDLSSQRTDVISPPKCPVAVGDVVTGKYRVEKVIGTGGMGSVVAAWHGELNQRVALKFMLPQFASDAEAAARFSREARSAARLRSPHVCRVLDLDKLANGTPFLVMEFLEGETLEQRLERDKKIAPERAVHWVLQAVEALTEAHGVGIVHRDLKPANLFLTLWQGQETVKVLDFGIAKSVDPEIEHGLKSTSQNMMIGSPPYMAPEQLNPGRKVDARADIWATGVVLYQLISGQLPFKNDNLVDLMFAIKNQAHPPLREQLPSLSMQISQVIDTCLSKAPEARFQTVENLSRALHAALGHAPAKAAAAKAGEKPKEKMAFAASWLSALPRFSVPPLSLPRSRGAWVGAAVVSLAAVGLIAMLARSPSPQVATAAADDTLAPLPAAPQALVGPVLPEPAPSAALEAAPVAELTTKSVPELKPKAVARPVVAPAARPAAPAKAVSTRPAPAKPLPARPTEPAAPAAKSKDPVFGERR